MGCTWSQAHHQAQRDEQHSLPLASQPLYISIKRCCWRGFCKVSHRVWAAQCAGQGTLQCLHAAQLFISHFCIYKRLIHEAPATQGKQLFGDSSILGFFFFFFFLLVFQALSLLCFFSWGVVREGACRIMKSSLFPGRQLQRKLGWCRQDGWWVIQMLEF